MLVAVIGRLIGIAASRQSLLVVENKSVYKRLRKRIAYELRESYEELQFATTKLEHILEPKRKGKVWFPIDEDGGDPEEPRKAAGLSCLQ